MSSTTERKLAAIMFADIVGYSRMMSLDEEKTLDLLKDFEEICNPIVQSYNGEILKKIGDEIFCEFNSAKNAVDAAMQIQKEISKYNDSRPKDFKLLVRVGIHIGDVVKRDGDIYGDGVNVASRIQPLANPGGIAITSSVQDALRSHEKYEIIEKGHHEIKNILDKYSIYQVTTGFEQTDKLFKAKKSFKISIQTIVFSTIILALGTFLILRNKNEVIDIKSNDMVNIYLPTIYSTQFVSKGETASQLIGMLNLINSDFDLDTENIVFSQIDPNWIDSIYSDILVNLTSKYFQKHKLFSMNDIEHALAKKGKMVDFNIPSMVERSSGGLDSVMTQLDFLTNEDPRLECLKDSIGTSMLHFFYLYNIKPVITEEYDIFIIHEKFETNKGSMEDATSSSGSVDFNMVKSDNIVDEIIKGIEEDTNAVLFSKYPSTVISQNGGEVLIKTHPLAKPQRYSTFGLERKYDCTDLIKFSEKRIRHVERFFSFCDTTQNIEHLDMCDAFLNNKTGIYMYSRKEYNDLLEHKHLYCSGDNFTMSLGINIVVEEVYDSTAIGIMEDPPPWLKLEKGDKLVIE